MSATLRRFHCSHTSIGVHLAQMPCFNLVQRQRRKVAAAARYPAPWLVAYRQFNIQFTILG